MYNVAPQGTTGVAPTELMLSRIIETIKFKLYQESLQTPRSVGKDSSIFQGGSIGLPFFMMF